MRSSRPTRCWNSFRCAPNPRFYSTVRQQQPPPWRPVSALDDSANYVRTELPTRLAHRLRDIQQLPYVVVANPHLSLVYELYYKAFERFRVIPEICSLDDNDRFCDVLREMLREHLVVIPNLAMGVLECRDLVPPNEMDKFMNTLLRARISRRVIAEQHLALTETFNSPWHFPDSHERTDMNADFVGEVFLKCKAKQVVERCGRVAQDLMRQTSQTAQLPEINVQGHLDATFPYILSHLEYIVGELLRNSVQAVVEKYHDSSQPPPPIEVLICETPQHVIMRISDQGGGIPREILPYLWSFSKGPRTKTRLENLGQVPAMAATMQELKVSEHKYEREAWHEGSLDSLTSRPPNLRLGMGLPMSRVYAEYWAGSLELHSLEGYGVDAFLQISKLGNKNEQVTTRAAMDAV
ncbi:uncharacterized protein N7473_003572 [Penicillium subrubescens]|uniref:uncharacterized protein n=1 Tax=Penicillium subrubescens TaxID=1316194 RepID=UPI00254579D1|nr:uncharacterized protein N7473_003572 [Penicillium subrubescens]KAJ5906656.1 hypothetical protein N7473_003572 [Penicillium subrubescens]